jgi:lysine 2,3-aminomutase
MKDTIDQNSADDPPDRRMEIEKSVGNRCLLVEITPNEPDWKKLLRESVTSPKELAKISGFDEKTLTTICKKYPVRIPKYYLSLIKEKNDAIFNQCMPSLQELEDPVGLEDPLHEEDAQRTGQVPIGITHRYPDRVLFLVTNQCAMYCRFCTRKRRVGDPNKPKKWSEIEEGLEYIKNHPEIRDVILSGGDPLLLGDNILEKIIKRIRSIPHIEIIRIGSRIPCTLPQRITPELCNMLKKYHPIYVNTHFNHPDEITPESEKACSLLVDAGIPVGCQTVLLKGVNDSPKVMKELMQKLVKIRVKPYYIYQADLVKGTNHFRTKVEKGLEIIKSIRGHTSGICVPHFVIDAPGGGGKIPVLPEYVKEIRSDKVIMSNYKDETYEYLQVE